MFQPASSIASRRRTGSGSEIGSTTLIFQGGRIHGSIVGRGPRRRNIRGAADHPCGEVPTLRSFVKRARGAARARAAAAPAARAGPPRCGPGRAGGAPPRRSRARRRRGRSGPRSVAARARAGSATASRTVAAASRACDFLVGVRLVVGERQSRRGRRSPSRRSRLSTTLAASRTSRSCRTRQAGDAGDHVVVGPLARAAPTPLGARDLLHALRHVRRAAGSGASGCRSRAGPPAGSTTWRRSRTCSRGASRTSRRRGSARASRPGSGRGAARRSPGSAWRSRRRAAGSR